MGLLKPSQIGHISFRFASRYKLTKGKKIYFEDFVLNKIIDKKGKNNETFAFLMKLDDMRTLVCLCTFRTVRV